MLRFFLLYQRGIKGHNGDGSICALMEYLQISRIKNKGTDRTVPFAPRPLCAPKNKSRTPERIRDFIV